MKGVAIAVLIAALVAFCGIATSMPPLIPPVQYEQFCENQKVAGTGVIDMSTSIVDKKIALEYYNVMAGDGAIELDQEQAYSQNADKLKRELSSMEYNDDKRGDDKRGHDGPKTMDNTETVTLNNEQLYGDNACDKGGCPEKDKNDKTNLNLYENSKLTYSGETPLVGGKYLHSKNFYGGIGADIQEMFAVNEMEKEQEAFFASTTPYDLHPEKNHKGPGPQPYTGVADPKNFKSKSKSPESPEQLIHELERAGRDTERVDELMGNNPAHLIGLDTKSSFNGTWGTDAKWHKIFYKDIKAHEMFTGKFEAEKLLKFHEYPVKEKYTLPCAGIDC
jgi:hypothetical protein